MAFEYRAPQLLPLSAPPNPIVASGAQRLAHELNELKRMGHAPNQQAYASLPRNLHLKNKAQSSLTLNGQPAADIDSGLFGASCIVQGRLMRPPRPPVQPLRHRAQEWWMRKKQMINQQQQQPAERAPPAASKRSTSAPNLGRAVRVRRVQCSPAGVRLGLDRLVRRVGLRLGRPP